MAAFGARGAGYGLDAELCRQREAKYDYEAEDKARVSQPICVLGGTQKLV